MKVLFVGLGSIGQRHLRNLRAILGDALEVSAYRVRGDDVVLSDSVGVEAAQGLEKRHQIQVFKDLTEALSGAPDAVFITNPTSLHMPAALEAARAGCHVFIEKPLSHSWEGVEELIQLMGRSGRVGYVGYQWRFHPAIRRIQGWLTDGLVGRLVAARVQVAEYMPNFHKYEDYRGTYAARKDLGGGCILSQIHELDLLYSFFGAPRRAFCVGGHLSDLEIDVEDVASTLMEFSRTDGAGFPVHLHQDFLQRPPERTCQIVGDHGKILWNAVDQSLVRYDAEGNIGEEMSFRAFERNQMFMDQTKHFLDCVAGRCRPLISLRDGAQSLLMALAAKRSLATGRPAELSEGTLS
ncbi:MAG: Gfo/Idh/MocA family oxidoreductase [Planctomycetes bacterium]|nr:Gfo/Idh/MocA family oxidoreductase [Planctomycetota bacterium]